MKLAAICMAVIVLGGSTGVAVAQTQASAPLGDGELSGQRGGIRTPTGLDVGFAASVRTYVDGEMVLESRMNWTADGVVRDQTGPLAGSADQAVQIPGVGGVTRVQHDLDGRVANVVLNTASDRSIRQDTDLTLSIPQLPQLQQQVAAARQALSLRDAVDSALVHSGR